jgi:DNA processing protein
MNVKELTPTSTEYPDKLRHIPMPPKQLFVLGQNVNELLTRPSVTIVGSRKVSTYGRTVTSQLAEELARAGIVIISGLALGVDSIAHKAAVDVNFPTIAVLPCGLDRIYPAQHRDLARHIVEQGGALVTEYPAGANVYQANFIARNRIGSGLGDAVLIIEAAERSGTLATARFALEQGKDVLAVPGNITSVTSTGTNNLIKSGATPVTCVEDILHVLGIQPAKAKKHTATTNNPNEQLLLELLQSGIDDGAALLAGSALEISLFNQSLTMLEIRGLIRPLGNNHWALQ